MQIRTRALVFSAIKYGEADLVVSCYTQSSGVKSYLLRGILKSKRGKLRKSMFQPLSLLEMDVIHKDKGTLERIQEAKVSEPYQSLHSHVVKSSLVLFLSEILKNSVREEEANEPLFTFLWESFLWLDQSDAMANFHLLFLLKLSGYLGFYPDFDGSDYPYFNIMEGTFQESGLTDYCREGDAIEALKGLHGKGFDALKEIHIPKHLRMELLEIMLQYYQVHIHGFHKPKSLSVLSELFH